MIINRVYNVHQNPATLQLTVKGPGLWMRESCGQLLSARELEMWGRRMLAEVERNQNEQTEI